MKFNDFFKPRWKHSDPKVRYEAIKELVAEFNLKDLMSIALSDETGENRKLALKKIIDEESLKLISETAEDRVTREAAQKKLNEIWAKRIKSKKDEAEILVLLQQITDPKCLENIALTDKNRKVREECLNKLTNPNSIYKVALKENETELALCAFEKLDKTTQFETLARNANNKTVRLKAKEKISGNGKTPAPPSQRYVENAKLELLCATVESHLESQNWEASAKAVKDAEEAWKHFESNAVKASPRFEKAVRDFWDRYGQHRQKEEKRAAEEANLKDHLAKKESLCEALDKLLSAKKTSENVEQIEGIIRAWNGLKGDYPEAQSLNMRYQTAVVSYRREFKVAAENQLKQEKAAGILERLETLLPMLLPSKMEHSLEKLKEHWSELEIDKDSEEHQKFTQQCLQVEEAIGSARENLKENQAKTLIQMRKLADKVEKLIDDPDLISSEKHFKEWTHTWRNLDPGDNVHPSHRAEYEAVVRDFQGGSQRYTEAQEWLRWANLKKKQDICEQIQTALDKNTDPLKLFERLRELQAGWRSIGPVSWENSVEVWDTYRKLLDEVYERCQEVIQELKEERRENLEKKRALCEKVESLGEVENWKEATDAVKQAQGEWKNIGPVPRDESESIWGRFRAACDAYFTRRREHFDSLDKNKDENLVAKEKLCELVEAHQNSTNWKEAAEIFKKAQEDWKATGPVPKEKMDAIWGRFRAACDTFFHARDNQFNEYSINKAENLAKKEALCLKVEALDQLEKDSDRFEVIKQAQAEWKTIGPVERDKTEELWERFRKPIDAFFEGRKEKFEEEKGQREENLKLKEELCAQAEAIAESEEWKATSEKLKALQAEWKKVGPAPRKEDKEVWVRFRSACDNFFGRMKEHYRQMDDQRELNLRVKEDLCFQAESLAGITNKNEGNPDEPLLQEGTHGGGNMVEKIKELQKRWKQTGPVHRSKSDELWGRFRAACDYVYDLAQSGGKAESVDHEANLKAKLEICENAERIANQVHTDAQIMKIKDLQREWKSIGPVEPSQHKELWGRFKSACDSVFAQDVRLQE